MTRLAAPTPATSAAVGRPVEIEEWTNRRLVHPLSRALVRLLIPTGISPNSVSVAGAVAAVAAGAAFVLLPWPASPLAGFALMALWHVLDGADGDLARRTGRASPNGELVDGICDHLGQAAIYVAFAILLQAQFGAAAWALAAGAGVSRAIQASAYERCRRNYRRWVHGAPWIRQTLAGVEAAARTPGDRIKAGLGALYLGVSAAVSADDRGLERAMEAQVAGAQAERARATYRARMLPLVRFASILSANWRTCAAFLSVLAGRPLLFVLYEVVAMNAALLAVLQVERTATRKLAAELGPAPG